MEKGIIDKSLKKGEYKFENFEESEIELVGYSFLVYQRGKLPRLKPADERYIIYMYRGRI
jgi:hypothetical protein